MSALSIQHGLKSLVRLNGSSDRPLYSLVAGFIVTNNAANGEMRATGILISDSVSVSLLEFLLSLRYDIAFRMFSISVEIPDNTCGLNLLTSSKHPTEPERTMPASIRARLS